jgi:NitT/TauT family transport system substrate-binding protein
MTFASRRDVLKNSAAAGAASLIGARGASAAAPTKIKFLTSWFAEAEHGGFYQAVATGLYAKSGLDVTVEMGGPQLNGMQLLLGGAADVIMGYDIQVLKGIENKLPVTTIAACFQFDIQGIMTHPDVKSLAGLKGHKILIANASYVTFWPWLKQKYGFTDDQAAPDTFNLGPFLNDPTIATQGYPTSEPFDAAKAGAKTNFFLFADEGYPPYCTTMVTTTAFLKKNPQAAKDFVRCSLLGWKDYFANPAPGNALMKQANPKLELDQVAFAIDKLKAMNVLGKGDAATQGIGTMTADRWKKTYDFLVGAKLLSPSVDWRAAFTSEYTQDLHIMPA